MIDDFDTQASLLKDRFIEKGYDRNILDKEISGVRSLDRDSLLIDQTKPNTSERFKWPFFTTFSGQHYKIKKSFKKHWSVLKNDRVLGPILPDKPGYIFRGLPSLQASVAPNILDLPKRIPFFQQ